MTSQVDREIETSLQELRAIAADGMATGGSRPSAQPKPVTGHSPVTGNERGGRSLAPPPAPRPAPAAAPADRTQTAMGRSSLDESWGQKSASNVAAASSNGTSKVESGMYAGKTRNEAVSLEIERLRESTKAQRKNMIVQTQQRVEQYREAIERSTAHFNVTADELDAAYDEAFAKTQQEIDRTNELLRALHERLNAEKQRHATEKSKMITDYQENVGDLQALLAAEEAALVHLTIRPNQAVTAQEVSRQLDNLGVPTPESVRSNVTREPASSGAKFTE